jgi:hypothetical protein
MVEMAKLRTDSGQVYSCIIRDLSDGGALLRVPTNGHFGGRVQIIADILGGERAASVKWQDQTSIGVAFDEAE